jgi:hypothetical protein
VCHVRVSIDAAAYGGMVTSIRRENGLRAHVTGADRRCSHAGSPVCGAPEDIPVVATAPGRRCGMCVDASSGPQASQARSRPAVDGAGLRERWKADAADSSDPEGREAAGDGHGNAGKRRCGIRLMRHETIDLPARERTALTGAVGDTGHSKGSLSARAWRACADGAFPRKAGSRDLSRSRLQFTRPRLQSPTGEID